VSRGRMEGLTVKFFNSEDQLPSCTVVFGKERKGGRN
jgi:hypothetical protein